MQLSQAWILCLSALNVVAWMPPPRHATWTTRRAASRAPVALRAAADDDNSPAALLEAAAKLRAEAEAIETEMKSAQDAKYEAALQQAFKAADENSDGVVTVEELRAALKAAFVTDEGRGSSRMAALLDAEKSYVEDLVKALDENEDGVLQPDEMVPLGEMRSRLEDEWRKDRAAASREEAAARRLEDEDDTRRERLDAFDAVANKTDAATRAIGVASYLLPALDTIPPPSPEAMASALGPLEQLSVAYHNFPFSGLLVFILLSNVASNAAAPRLQRFSARHAIVLDLASAVGLPLALALGGPGALDPARLAFAGLILASVGLTAFGVEPGLVPGTGQLTKKFTDDFDSTVRQVISATVGTAPLNITELVDRLETRAEDEDADNDDASKK